MAQVPTLSLVTYTHGDEAARGRFCREVFEGLTRYGFVIIQDHPVSEPLLEQAYALSEAFFARPDEEKHRYLRPNGQRGYTPFGVEHAKDHPAPDLKEFWHVGPESGPDGGAPLISNVWPDSPSGFQRTFSDLYRALHNAAELILEALTPGLDVPSDFFTNRVRGGESLLRLLHYPPIPGDADPLSVRAAPHEDINLITLLVAAQGAGLELLDRDGQWLPVEGPRNAIIVDSGDMLARMTNEVIPATTHRVVNPAGPNVSRYSMPFFMHPRSDVMLSCVPSCIGAGVKYPDITAGAYLTQRLEEIGLKPTPA